MNILNKIKNEIGYSLIPGIAVEIKDFLEWEELVHVSSVETTDKHYKVTIELVEYSLSNAKRVFSSLLEFIQYETVHYSRSEDESGIFYELISFNSTLTLSYYCEISFMK